MNLMYKMFSLKALDQICWSVSKKGFNFSYRYGCTLVCYNSCQTWRYQSKIFSIKDSFNRATNMNDDNYLFSFIIILFFNVGLKFKKSLSLSLWQLSWRPFYGLAKHKIIFISRMGTENGPDRYSQQFIFIFWSRDANYITSQAGTK